VKVRSLDIQNSCGSRNIPIRLVERLKDAFAFRGIAGLVEGGS
jgi:hypothetical protein